VRGNGLTLDKARAKVSRARSGLGPNVVLDRDEEKYHELGAGWIIKNVYDCMHACAER
jgi:hypothetical protein